MTNAIEFVNTCWHMNDMANKPTVKPTKSERTRAAILEAARELFMEFGYQAATVRDVAHRASIDPAMVIRYFGSKEELFARAASIRLNVPQLQVVDKQAIGETLVRHFLDLWEGPASSCGMAVLLRSAASNEFAAEKMRDVFAAQVRPVVASVGDPATAARRAGLVSSQLLGLAMCRYILRLPPVVALSQVEIVRMIGPTLQSYVMATDHGDATSET